MRQKKLMLLGGIRYLLPVIEAAHEQGYYVITADYLPDNIAHRYSDEYVNVSIIDKEAVLKVAREKEIDGILSFGVDMITAGVRAAVGDSVDGIEQKPYMGHWAEIILHSDKDGLFESLYISKSMRSYVIEEDLWVMKGDAVHFFEGATTVP